MAFDLVRADKAAGRVPARLMAIYYAMVLALPFAMTRVAGYWWAIVATLGTLALVRLVPVARERRLRGGPA